MANTMTLIASSTVGSGGTATVTFSSIPSTYTDLVLKYSSRFDSTDNIVSVSFNGSTTSFTNKLLYGTGTAAQSEGASFPRMIGESTLPTYTANTFSNSEVYIPNYAGSTNKSWSSDSVTENNATAAYQLLNAGLWSNTAAITSIAITNGNGSFTQYSTFYLYGISKS